MEPDEENEQPAGVAVIVAAAGDDPAAGLPARWAACLVVEGFRTTDRRAISANALTWRDVPLPLACQFSTECGHDGAVPVGQIDSITRDGTRIMATGTFDLGSDVGREAARLCNDQVIRFVSIDMEVLDAAYIETDDDWFEEVLAGRIGMATMVMLPAFPQACIVPEGMTIPTPEPYGGDDKITIVPAPLIASGDIDLANPPASWFTDPALQELTHLTVTDEGRVFGHLAGWGIAHRGIQGRQVFAPRSPSGYRHFATGTTVCMAGADDTLRVSTGVLTMGIGHADGRSSLASAAAHYDNVNYGVADVVMGEDEFGIWFSGAVRGSVDADRLRVLRASDLSGDWRPTAEGHELVAALVVNVAGFLIPNSLVASAAYSTVATACFTQYRHGDTDGAIVAAGMVRRADPLTELRREVANLRAVIEPLLPLVASAIDEGLL